jgi:hypothetical protein
MCCGLGGSTSMRILREDGINMMEDLMYDEDLLIRRVGLETLVNLLYCDKVFEQFATKEGKKWEMLKIIILLSGCPDEDYSG